MNSETAGRHKASYRWLVCALLFFATTINYIDRQILSLVKPILDKELGWTDAQFGVVSAAFQGAYAVGLLGFGWFVDRFGTKIGYSVSIGFWSLAAMSHAFVGSIAGFRWARIFLGVSESGNFPSAIKVVGQWFPPAERAFANSLFNSGANMGAIIAPATVLPLAYWYGWKIPFILAGIAGFIWLLFWLWLYEVPGRKQPAWLSAEDAANADPKSGTPAEPKIRWIDLLGYRQAWTFIVCKFLTDPVWWFFLTWLPDYFNKSRGLDLKHLGAPLIEIYSIVTVVGISGGWLSKVLVRRGMNPSAARKLTMLIFALCVVPILFVKDCGLNGAVCLIGLAAGAHQAWSANLYTTVLDMFPNRAVASVIGIGGLAGSAGGMLFQIFVGNILDHFKLHGGVSIGYSLVFAICASAYLIAFGISHLLVPRFEPIQVRKAVDTVSSE